MSLRSVDPGKGIGTGKMPSMLELYLVLIIQQSNEFEAKKLMRRSCIAERKDTYFLIG